MKEQLKGYIQNLKQRYHLKDYRFSLVILVTALSIIGVFIVGSAQADLQWRQLQGVILGLIAMFIISLIDYNWILKFYWVMYAVNLVLLAAVLLFGETVNGATRWLNLGFIQFQPSDLTKLLMILFFAKFLMNRERDINDKKTIIQGIALILPSLILVLDKPLQRTRHKSLIPDMGGFAKGVCKIFPVFLVIFALLIAPAYISYDKTNDEVYYDMGQCLPEDMEYVIANKKLSQEFDIASTHMLLVNADLPDSDVRAMIDEMEQVPGVKYVLGMESVAGPMIPMEVLPDSVRSMLESDQWELLLINSEYKVASDDVNQQIDQLNAILKKYDEGGMLIGEAPCMKDMIETTDHDFKVVNAISIAAIFLIITLVEGSFSLPFILIAVIELAIFINLGLPHVLGQWLPFIAPICISTIQLGATVDYAILMTTRYKAERLNGEDKKKAVMTALRTSAPSIIVSGMGLFAATFGVALYSNIDIVGSMCMLMARGAIISVLLVLLVLPALLILCDGIVCRTTRGMTHLIGKQEVVK